MSGFAPRAAHPVDGRKRARVTTAVANARVKRGGRWQWFAAQETVIPDTP